MSNNYHKNFSRNKKFNLKSKQLHDWDDTPESKKNHNNWRKKTKQRLHVAALEEYEDYEAFLPIKKRNAHSEYQR